MVENSSQQIPSRDSFEGKKIATIVSLLIFMLGTLLGYAFHYKMKPYSREETNDPQGLVFLETNHFSLLYDGRTKNPVWVKENIVNNTADIFSWDKTSKSSLPQVMQSSLSDYQNSEFKVGNLLTSLGDEAFYMPATSPQVPQFNQGYWKKLNKYVKTLLEAHQITRLVTITGPLYLPHENAEGKHYVYYQVIGKDNIAVPTHFFKIIYLPPNISLEPEVYLIPNESINTDVALEIFKINLEKLELISGISFQKNSDAYLGKPIVGPL